MGEGLHYYCLLIIFYRVKQEETQLSWSVSVFRITWLSLEVAIIPSCPDLCIFLGNFCFPFCRIISSSLESFSERRHLSTSSDPDTSANREESSPSSYPFQLISLYDEDVIDLKWRHFQNLSSLLHIFLQLYKLCDNVTNTASGGKMWLKVLVINHYRTHVLVSTAWFGDAYIFDIGMFSQLMKHYFLWHSNSR